MNTRTCEVVRWAPEDRYDRPPLCRGAAVAVVRCGVHTASPGDEYDACERHAREAESHDQRVTPIGSEPCTCRADLDEPGSMHSHTCALRTTSATPKDSTKGK